VSGVRAPVGDWAAELERARYRELFELGPNANLVTDANGTVLEANSAAASLFDVRLAQLLIGKPLAGFVSAEGRRGFRQRLLDVGGRSGSTRWEFELQPGRGVPVHVEATVVPAQAGAGAGELRWAIRSLDERVRTQDEIRRLASELEQRVIERTAALEEERARLETVVQQMPLGVLIVDRDGASVVANGEAVRILRRPDLKGADTPSGFPLDRSLRTGEVVTGERCAVERGGGGRAVLDVSSAAIRDLGGRIIGAVAIFQDVTRRERAERAGRDFVANAAHELQSPLAAILSAVDVLQAGAKDSEQRDLFLGHVEREAKRLARLARVLLVLAQAETGGERPKDEVVALAPLLAEAVTGVEVVSGVRLEVHCPADLGVVSNHELIEQALSNLVRNAARVTRHGSISLTAQALDGQVEISVSDTGPGMAPETQARAFERFYRAEAPVGEGFGLGLAIVQAAVQALGGEVELESEVGAGTTVRMRLPVPATLVR
jgi:PAS domain S-box-containing protein